MTAWDILQANEPGELFSGNAALIKDEYMALVKYWHPDNHGGSRESNAITAKINGLYQKGLDQLREGIWRKPGFISILSTDGKRHEIHYLSEEPFELGTCFICDDAVIYLLEQSFSDFYHNAEQVIGGFTFADAQMYHEISGYLPEVISRFEAVNGKWGMVLAKTTDMLRLKDVLTFYGGELPDRHAAWILSRLYNLACYLDFSGLTHNAISIENWFVSPQSHSGALLGGWWYAVPRGAPMAGVPESTYTVLPPQVLASKRGSILTDLECIRSVGRELLGDRTGSRLTASSIPRAFAEWLRGAPAATAFEEYTRWEQVLTKSYGRRRFVVMDLDSKALYERLNNNKRMMK